MLRHEKRSRQSLCLRKADAAHLDIAWEASKKSVLYSPLYDLHRLLHKRDSLKNTKRGICRYTTEYALKRIDIRTRFECARGEGFHSAVTDA